VWACCRTSLRPPCAPSCGRCTRGKISLRHHCEGGERREGGREEERERREEREDREGIIERQEEEVIGRVWMERVGEGEFV
jgi:hypothetical protein